MRTGRNHSECYSGERREVLLFRHYEHMVFASNSTRPPRAALWGGIGKAHCAMSLLPKFCSSDISRGKPHGAWPRELFDTPYYFVGVFSALWSAFWTVSCCVLLAKVFSRLPDPEALVPKQSHLMGASYGWKSNVFPRSFLLPLLADFILWATVRENSKEARIQPLLYLSCLCITAVLCSGFCLPAVVERSWQSLGLFLFFLFLLFIPRSWDFPWFGRSSVNTFSKVPPSSCHQRMPLWERKHHCWECGRGFPWAFTRLPSFAPLQCQEDAHPIPPSTPTALRYSAQGWSSLVLQNGPLALQVRVIPL